jgi:hypothetical protein
MLSHKFSKNNDEIKTEELCKNKYMKFGVSKHTRLNE